MRTLLITGASGGIAQAFIETLPKSDRLILLGRDAEKLEKRYDAWPNKRCLAYDVMDNQALVALVTEIGASESIDVLVNTAGFGEYKDYQDFSCDEVEAMFQVNTFATMTFCRLLGPRMAQKGAGHIINVVSMSGLVATAQSSVYCASKYAVTGFSDAIRLELADQGVQVTTINPGPVATGFFDLADPEGVYLEKVKAFTLSPQAVAKKMVEVLDHPRPSVNLPWTLNFAYKFSVLFPRFSQFLSRKVFNYK
ncbi:SDR family NAD(P)-dependent oxidoreductase [Streptococcus sp. DD12]|uniref:SDR family NAD(P)-dependent oxidoreductase n=1 Tax=Streptococcus sp. DD12 TaxID=1777880 RepID=UPI000795D92B|nr:SDR family oxidoreductase [Streptococcus sp. DD12]KXT76301.1 Short chain dehydrogenase [Streptococcus sp. DD12]